MIVSKPRTREEALAILDALATEERARHNDICFNLWNGGGGRVAEYLKYSPHWSCTIKLNWPSAYQATAACEGPTPQDAIWGAYQDFCVERANVGDEPPIISATVPPSLDLQPLTGPMPS